jgi:NAD(P)-dependent dehydrogenase (short-subunit alcohol dehydrogenase family)
MTPLHGKIAVVTGGSRGVGKGIALELMERGARVFVTGRTEGDLRHATGNGTPIVCDHSDDAQVAAAFEAVLTSEGRIDILVNNVWGGYENMAENGEFTWLRPFWAQPLWRWDRMFTAGVRAHFASSRLAAPGMVERKSGLIVNISFWAAQKYIGNVPYGVAKAATDKLTSDMAHELRPHNVTVLSLYPGMVRTEKVMEAAAFLDLSNSESPRLIGRAVAALASEPDVIRRTGSVVIAAEVVREHGIADVDGKSPRPLTLADV